MNADKYTDFLKRKSQIENSFGFEPTFIPDYLFDFQQALVRWSLIKGRSAIFANTGTGKTIEELVWGVNVAAHTNMPVLLLTPLAVSFQTVQEAEKFGIEAKQSRDGRVYRDITVTNYEKLHLFNPGDFGGVICDESSCLKNFSGATKRAVTEFMKKIQFRLLATATPSPNDYIELGTSSEALGELGYMDMLNRFFKNDQNNSALGRDYGKAQKWRFKGHAELPFWRWVCSWARAVRKPSDLDPSFNDARFELPPLLEREHVVNVSTIADGMLFNLPACGLQEQREERRRSIKERCEKVAELVNGHEDCSLIWCHLNPEGDLLEKIIPNAIQIKGSDGEEYREAAIRWFVGDKCICNEPMFRTKLSAWKNTHQNISRNIIKNIASEYSRESKNSVNKIQTEIKNISSNIISPINGNTKEQKIKMTSEISGGANGMQMIKSTDVNSLNNQKQQEIKTQIQGLNGCSSNMECHSKNTKNSLTQDAQFAETVDRLIKPEKHQEQESDDCMLTTVIAQTSSEDYSALSAISDLENSKIVQSYSKRPQCICGHSSGQRRLISKQIMFGWGLNFQHCSHIVTFTGNSFEQYYQGIRRCYRFGQTQPVTVDIVTTEGEQSVLKNLQRKSEQATRMFENLVRLMHDAEIINRQTINQEEVIIPSWIK